MLVALHIGLPKTATSLLQNWLDINALNLEPRIGVLSSISGGHRLAVEMAQTEADYHRSDFADIRRMSLNEALDQVERLRAKGLRRIVCSSEYFYTAPPQSARKAFESWGLRVDRILCFLRRQDRLIASGYVQDVKMLGWADPVAPGGYAPCYDWGSLIATWQHAFPSAEILVHDFDHVRASQQLLSTWKFDLGIADLDTDDGIAMGPDKVNESLTAELTEVCRLANANGYREVVQLAMRAQAAGLRGTPFRLREEHLIKVREAYQESNRALEALPNASEFVEYMPEQWQADSGDDFSGSLDPTVWLALLRHAIKDEKEPAPEIVRA